MISLKDKIFTKVTIYKGYYLQKIRNIICVIKLSCATRELIGVGKRSNSLTYCICCVACEDTYIQYNNLQLFY